MSARRLIVWRHGRTAWNHTRRFQGQTDIPLDDVGRAQAAAAAPVLATYSPAVLVSSDLSRAAQTAAALAEVTGLSPMYDPDLREIDVGSWAGLLVEDVRRKDGPLYARVEGHDIDARRGGDGETLRELADRAEKAFRRALELGPEGSTVVAASHGLATKVGIAQLVGLPPEQWGAFGGLDNCAWVIVEPRPDGAGDSSGHGTDGRSGWRIRGWNLRAPQSPGHDL